MQSYQKMSLIKVTWYVLRVKNMHFESSLKLWDSWVAEKTNYRTRDITGRRYCSKIVSWASKLSHKNCIKKLVLKNLSRAATNFTSMFYHLPSVGPKHSTPNMYPRSRRFLAYNISKSKFHGSRRMSKTNFSYLQTQIQQRNRQFGNVWISPLNKKNEYRNLSIIRRSYIYF